MVYQAWQEKEVGVGTLNGNTLKFCGVESIKLGVDDIAPFKILIVGGQLLGFDLLLELTLL